jgi:hypothetical protein
MGRCAHLLTHTSSQIREPGTALEREVIGSRELDFSTDAQLSRARLLVLDDRLVTATVSPVSALSDARHTQFFFEALRRESRLRKRLPKDIMCFFERTGVTRAATHEP